MMPHAAKQTDVAIQEAVLGELRWDSRVNATDVGVLVHHAIVTLTGRVETLGERLAAQEAAHRVAGVLDVANDIEVALPDHHRTSDPDVAEAIRHALDWSSHLPAQNIRTDVSFGVVALEGDVASLAEREDAEQLIGHVNGVRAVVNHLKVTPPSMTPADVRQCIADALERQAIREARHVAIDVDDGVVTLEGRVRSWSERRAIVGVVSALRGVAAVNDRLTVDRST